MSGAIWLASYPRSGNTWTRLALSALHDGAAEVDLDEIGRFAPIASQRRMMDQLLEVDSGLLTEDEVQELRPEFHAAMVARPGAPQVYKTHDAWFRTPSGRPVYDAAFTAAALYIIRDPRDVAISWARFNGQEIDGAIAFMGEADAALAPSVTRIARQMRQPMGSWSDHVRSWIDEADIHPLITRYEDMIADPAAGLARIAAHIGWDPSAEAIDRAVNATRFEQLADQERRFGFRERAGRTERFFRQGKAGAWRDTLTAEQVARIERDHGEVMSRFGYL
jgi:hypothetical protein